MQLTHKLPTTLNAEDTCTLSDNFLFRDLVDPMDPLVRMVELEAMVLWVLLVLVDPLDTSDLL